MQIFKIEGRNGNDGFNNSILPDLSRNTLIGSNTTNKTPVNKSLEVNTNIMNMLPSIQISVDSAT